MLARDLHQNIVGQISDSIDKLHALDLIGGQAIGIGRKRRIAVRRRIEHERRLAPMGHQLPIDLCFAGG